MRILFLIYDFVLEIFHHHLKNSEHESTSGTYCSFHCFCFFAGGGNLGYFSPSCPCVSKYRNDVACGLPFSLGAKVYGLTSIGTYWMQPLASSAIHKYDDGLFHLLQTDWHWMDCMFLSKCSTDSNCSPMSAAQSSTVPELMLHPNL